jgi:hypothetical protein
LDSHETKPERGDVSLVSHATKNRAAKKILPKFGLKEKQHVTKSGRNWPADGYTCLPIGAKCDH